MRAVLLYVSLAWLHLSLGFLARDTGSKELSQNLKRLSDEAAAAGTLVPTSIETYYFPAATKDNFFAGGASERWEPIDGIAGQIFKVSEDHYDPTTRGPIFLLIGAERALDDSDIGATSFIYHAASKHGALVLGLEHRYYGASRPTVGFDTPEEVQLLSSEQALADVNNFLIFIKENYGLPSDAPVIVFGYSYGGSLAAWFKRRYPHAAIGAISSSAPLVATVDFSQYLEVVGDALTYWGGQVCYDVVKAGVDSYTSKLYAQEFGTITDDVGFKITGVESGIAFGGDCMINPLSGIVQYNIGGKGPTVSEFCAEMTANAQASNPYNALIAFMTKQDKCDASANTVLDPLTEWTWEFCNEFGFLQTAVSAQQPFSSWGTVWNATYLYNSYCVANAKFGKLLPYSEPQTDYTNAIYGGLDFNADNVTFVHGSLDPWHRIGVAEGTVLRSGNVYYIEGGSHCNDATSPEYDGGSAALQRTRSNILYDIQYYLQGNPWDHHTTEDTSQASISGTKARWGGQDDACGFKIVTKRTKVTVKYGQQIKLSFSVQSRNPPGSDNLFIGVEHWNSGIHFVKSSVSPPVDRTQKAPDIDHIGAIFWENVPNRRSRTFKASFFSDEKGTFEFHPGVCLQDGINKSCCQYKTVQVNVVDP